MPNDTMTFAINGEITVERFAVAIRRFADLVAALNREAGETEVKWILSDLEYSSAIATAEARPPNGEWTDALHSHAVDVAHSFLRVGTALYTGEPVPFSDRVRDVAEKIHDLIDGDIESLRFETGEDDVTIERDPSPQPLPTRARPYAYGAVEGRVQAITNRGHLRFTIYDTIYDRAVSCYMMEGREEQMKDVWGKLAVVEGFVKRDPKTGRALTVRNIRNINLLAEPDPEAYKRARGAVPRLGDQERAEDVVRRVRDAG